MTAAAARTTPVWATDLIRRIYEAEAILGESRPQSEPIVHVHGHWFRKYVTPSCSLSVTRKELEKRLISLARRAIEREQKLTREAAEVAEVAYWEARGIHTGYPNVATIVLLP